MYTVYIIYSVSTDRYYKGQTSDFDSRLVRHNSGYEKATAPGRPWIEKCLIKKDSRSDAVILEKKLKNMNRIKTAAFILKYSQGSRQDAQA
jgi:putative endonuclease